ncbi:MAG: AI-2E family transporter, partial [Holdemania filiformis]
ILGFSLAFLLAPVTARVEKKWLAKSKMKPSAKRKVGVAAAIVFLFVVLISFMAILIPQLLESVMTLSTQLSDYLGKANTLLNEITEGLGFKTGWLEMVFSSSEALLESMLGMAKDYVPKILNYSWSFVRQTFNFFIAVIIAVYILLEKERFTEQFKKLAYALLPKPKVEALIQLSRLTSRMFNSFIIGKMIDSLIIGVICFIGMLIMRLPFAVLISFIVGLTNMIPVFGPFIGAVPGIFILFIVDPIYSLIFAVFVLLLQQFDGNILGPMILGDQLGLPSLWVMFSIIVGGGMFGILGMFLGVPVFAVLYVVVRGFVSGRLKEKNIRSDDML